MARKIRLTPVHRDVLWLLEEAGEEEVSTVISSLKEVEPEVFKNAVNGLIRLGFVNRSEWTEKSGGSLLLTNSGRQSLTR
jgi:hypothetical protein